MVLVAFGLVPDAREDHLAQSAHVTIILTSQ